MKLKNLPINAERRKWAFSIILLICCTFIASAQDAPDELSYDNQGSSAWVPYYIIENKQVNGIVGELVPSILDTANIRGIPSPRPPKRTYQALKNGELDFDIVNPAWFGGELAPQFIASDSLLNISEHLITLPENAKTFPDIKSVHGRRVGTVRGYSYHDSDQFERIDFHSEEALIQALQRQRVDVAIIARYPALYWSNKHNIDIVVGAVHTSGDLVLRLQRNKQHLLPRLNAAISQLRKQGDIKRLVDKYTQDLAPVRQGAILPEQLSQQR